MPVPSRCFPATARLDGLAALAAEPAQRLVLFTDLNDPQLAANLSESLQLASRRHVVVVVASAIRCWIESPPARPTIAARSIRFWPRGN